MNNNLDIVCIFNRIKIVADIIRKSCITGFFVMMEHTGDENDNLGISYDETINSPIIKSFSINAEKRNFEQKWINYGKDCPGTKIKWDTGGSKIPGIDLMKFSITMTSGKEIIFTITPDEFSSMSFDKFMEIIISKDNNERR